MNRTSQLLPLLLATLLTACGGGGSSTPSGTGNASGSQQDSATVNASGNPTTTPTPGSTQSTVGTTTSTTMAAAATLHWKPVNLGALNDDEESVAEGINNAGQIVGNSRKIGDNYKHPFLYANGVMEDMLAPVQQASIQPGIINNSGMVGGFTYQPQALDGGGPFVFVQGVYTRLGSGSGIYAINDDGKAVGNLNSQIYNPNPPAGSSPYTYRRSAFLYANGSMTDLTNQIDALYAYGINNHGDIVGNLSNGAAYLYRDGQVQLLGTLPGDATSLPLSINNAGAIVGISSPQNDIPNATVSPSSGPTAGWRAFLYQDGRMTDLNAAGGFTMSQAYFINNRGHVLGVATSNGTRIAYLYRDGGFINLSNLPELKSAGWSDVEFYHMNDADQIVGKGTIGGKQRALLLSPATTS